MNALKRTSRESHCTKPAHFERWPNFASVWTVEEFILRARKQKYSAKTERDVRLLLRFLKTKVEDRKVEAILAVELNEHISQFIISVRTKDGTEYEPTSLSSLTASFERHLKKKDFYSASIINDLVFDNTRKVPAKTAKEARKRESINPTHQ